MISVAMVEAVAVVRLYFLLNPNHVDGVRTQNHNLRL